MYGESSNSCRFKNSEGVNPIKVLRSTVTGRRVRLPARENADEEMRGREAACVDTKAVKTWGHRERKTLEVIHKHRMAHQHIPLTLSHSQTPPNLSHTASGAMTYTHLPPPLGPALWGFMKVFAWISSSLTSRWEGFFTCVLRWKILL